MKVNKDGFARLLPYLCPDGDEECQAKAAAMLNELYNEPDLVTGTGKEIMAFVTKETGSPALAVRMASLVERAKDPSSAVGNVFAALMSQQNAPAHPLAGFVFGGPGARECGKVGVSREETNAALERIKGKIVKAMQSGGGPGGTFAVDFGDVHVVGKATGDFFRVEIRRQTQVRPAAGFQRDWKTGIWSAESLSLGGAAQLIAWAVEGIGGQTVQKEIPAPLTAAAISALLLKAIKAHESELVIGDVTVIISDDQKTLTVKIGDEETTYTDVDQAVKFIAARQAASVQAEKRERHPLRQSGFQHSLDRPYTGTDVAT